MTKFDDEPHYGALSIDSNIFFGNGYRLNSGVLSQLKQFKESELKIIQSDIIHKECISHTSDYYAKQEAKVKRAVEDIHRYSEVESQEINDRLDDLILLIDSSQQAENKLSSFYDDIGAEIICSEDHVDIKTIVDMYFSTTPPFQEGEKKKHEFPDAIALRSLESWALDNDTKVLAVSNDTGWSDYAKGSDRIDVVNDLPEAISKLLPQQELLKLVSRIRDNNVLDESVISDFFIQDLHDIDLYSLNFDASSSFMYDIDDINAEPIKCDLDKDESGNIKIFVLNINDRKVRAIVMARMEIKIDFNIDFQKLDPVDKDVVSISYESVYVQTNYYAEAIIDIYLPEEGEEPSRDNVDIEVIDMSNDLDYVYLGDLEPIFPE